LQRVVSKLKSLTNSHWFLTNLPGQWRANGALSAGAWSEAETGKDISRPEGVMGKTVRKAPGLSGDLAEFVQNLARSLFDPYRPEQHYMRGPGPKWHAKHDRAHLAYRAIPVLVPVRVKR
jgi:hypothetical protein